MRQRSGPLAGALLDREQARVAMACIPLVRVPSWGSRRGGQDVAERRPGGRQVPSYQGTFFIPSLLSHTSLSLTLAVAAAPRLPLPALSLSPAGAPTRHVVQQGPVHHRRDHKSQGFFFRNYMLIFRFKLKSLGDVRCPFVWRSRSSGTRLAGRSSSTQR